MRVQHVRHQPTDQTVEAQPERDIAWPGFAIDGEAMNAEFQTWRNLLKRLLRTLTACKTVGNDPDLVAALGLAAGEINNVAERAPCIEHLLEGNPDSD